MSETVEKEFDLVVVGGGLSGVACAISAAREGLSTALVHERPVLGGNSSSEIRVEPRGAATHNPWARETGVIEELLIEERARNPEHSSNGLANPVWTLVLREWARKEDRLELFLNTVVDVVDKSVEGQLDAVWGVQLGTEKRVRFGGKYFADCTGDGTVGALAGAEFRMGREARNEFDEPHAPPEADGQTQGSSIMFCAVDAGRPVPFTPPPWAKTLSEEDLRYRGHGRKATGEYAGYWWIEVGVPYDTIAQNEEICDELLGYALGVWDHIKNGGEHDAESMALVWVGALPGKRESRRLVGDHILTENDIRSNAPFRDRVAYGGWFIDVHTMGGIKRLDLPPEELCGNADLAAEFRVRPYSIPLRSLYSKNVRNLFMAGRDASVTHMGLGSPRVMCTCAAMGGAVGVAAAVCSEKACGPRKVAEDHAGDVQERLLRAGWTVLDCPSTDSDDLCLGRPVRASSSAGLVPKPVEETAPLDRIRSAILPVSAGRIERVRLLVESRSKEKERVRLALFEAADIWDFDDAERKALATAEAEIEPGYAGWIEFAPGASVAPRSLVKLLIDGPPEVLLRRAVPQPGVTSASMKPEWSRLVTDKGAFAVELEPACAPFGPENVTNGVARPERWPNIWMSDPAEALPQWVEIDLAGEKEVRCVVISFDTNLHHEAGSFPPLYRAPECAADYTVELETAEGWRTVVEERGNYHRRRAYGFEPVRAKRLRLTVLATNGSPTAGVYEIRAYPHVVA